MPFENNIILKGYFCCQAESHALNLPAKSDKISLVMNKKLLPVMILGLSALTANAGGYLTTTNQNTAFYRMPAHNATIGTEGAYYDPAGIGFMDDGWHASLDIQTIFQRRHVNSTFAPFAYRKDNEGSDTRRYIGITNVPLLPHGDLAYKKGRWFGSLHLGPIAGGGSVKYGDGLGSFESNYAMLPALVNTLAGSKIVTAYSSDIDFTGGQTYWGGQLNFGFKVAPKLSVSVGARLVYATASYDGNISNIQLEVGGQMLPAGTAITNLLTAAAASNPVIAGIIASGKLDVNSIVGDRRVDVKQSAFGLAPIISVHYKPGKWDLSARYEFNTSIDLENDTKDAGGMSMFEDGKKWAGDVPALLALGAQYNFSDRLRLQAGYNLFFEKQAKTYNSKTDANDKQKLLDGNTYEILFGAEYDLSKTFTISAGGHKTTFGWDDDYSFLSDQGFSMNSWSFGLGTRIHFTDNLSTDLAVYKTFYSHVNKQSADYAPTITKSLGALGVKAVPGSDKMTRLSTCFGISFNYDF